MHRTLALIVFLVAACGGQVTDDPTTTAAPATTMPPTTTADPPTTTTTTVTSTTAPRPTLDRALEDRSLLSLIPDALQAGEGSFEIRDPRNTITASRSRGHFWITPEGNAYTRLDVDTQLVVAEMDTLIEAFTREGLDARLQTQMARYPRGDEYQIGIADLLISLGVFPSSDLIRLFFGGELDGQAGRCLADIEDSAEAASAFIRALTPDFVPDGESEVWAFPMADLMEAAPALPDSCAVLFSGEPDETAAEAVFRRTDGALEVLFDEGIYTDREPEPVLWITVSDLGVGTAPPSEPDPVSLFEPLSHFTVKTAECGRLPWVYSNFAAGDTYYSPEGPFYTGPFLADKFLCESEVPEDRRDDLGFDGD